MEAPISTIKILEGASSYLSLASGFPRSGTVCLLPKPDILKPAYLISMVALV